MKRQQLVTTGGSIYAALSYAVIRFIEDMVETEEELKGAKVPAYLLSPRDAINRITSEGEVEIYIPMVTEAERVITIAGHEVRLSVVKSPSGLVSALALYESSFRGVIMLDRELYKRLAQETTETGTEFMLIYSPEGSLASVEGERYRVRVPRVRASMTFHTHPEGHCGLSEQDLESAVDLLTEGGLASGSVTPSCASVMYRYGMVDVDDYVAFKEGRRVEGRSIRVVTMPI
ncbi:MAG: hypothetical protein ACP5FT_01050 [Acidilobus sp.]